MRLVPAALPLPCFMSPSYAPETCACDGFAGTLRLLNLALMLPDRIFSTVSRQLAANVLIHLIFPIILFACFFFCLDLRCPSTIKMERSEERGGGEKMCCLTDLVSTLERLAWNIMFFWCCFYNFKTMQTNGQMATHKSSLCLSNLKYPYFWVSSVPIISSSALPVLRFPEAEIKIKICWDDLFQLRLFT